MNLNHYMLAARTSCLPLFPASSPDSKETPVIYNEGVFHYCFNTYMATMSFRNDKHQPIALFAESLLSFTGTLVVNRFLQTSVLNLDF